MTALSLFQKGESFQPPLNATEPFAQLWSRKDTEVLPAEPLEEEGIDEIYADIWLISYILDNLSGDCFLTFFSKEFDTKLVKLYKIRAWLRFINVFPQTMIHYVFRDIKDMIWMAKQASKDPSSAKLLVQLPHYLGCPMVYPGTWITLVVSNSYYFVPTIYEEMEKTPFQKMAEDAIIQSVVETTMRDLKFSEAKIEEVLATPTKNSTGENNAFTTSTYTTAAYAQNGYQDPKAIIIKSNDESRGPTRVQSILPPGSTACEFITTSAIELLINGRTNESIDIALKETVNELLTEFEESPLEDPIRFIELIPDVPTPILAQKIEEMPLAQRVAIAERFFTFAYRLFETNSNTPATKQVVNDVPILEHVVRKEIPEDSSSVNERKKRSLTRIEFKRLKCRINRYFNILPP